MASLPVSSGAGDETPLGRPRHRGPPASDVFSRSTCRTPGPAARQTRRGTPCHPDLLLTRRVSLMSVDPSLGSFTSRPCTGGPAPRPLGGGGAWSPGLSRVVQGHGARGSAVGGPGPPTPTGRARPSRLLRGIAREDRAFWVIGPHTRPSLPLACRLPARHEPPCNKPSFSPPGDDSGGW